MKKHKHLVLFDFDNTLADTSKQEDRGMGVEEASGLAVGQLFGDEGLEYFWEKLGGLQNREPGELIGLLVQRLHWGDQINLKIVTELFVQEKLSYLLEGISSGWPKLFPGVKDFFKDVAEGRIPVDVGIVSSGHDAFIKKTLNVNGINPPDILVTSDVLRERYNSYAPARYKPSPYQIAVAHKLWLYGDSYELHKEGMVYVGDDPVKDGELAERSRIPFIFVPFSGKTFKPDRDKGQVAVTDFSEIGNILRENKALLEQGISMTELLTGRPHNEVFKRSPEGLLHNNTMIVDIGRSVMMRR